MIHSTLAVIGAPDTAAAERPHPELAELASLAGTATATIAAYGAAIHMAEGAGAMLGGAGRAVVTAGAAWALAMPALLVLGALLGSTLPWRRAVHVSLITVAFGGTAFLASAPVIALFELTWGDPFARGVINSLVVLGVGASSAVIFDRVMRRVGGSASWVNWGWMGLFGSLFLELAWLIDLFRFYAI